MVNRVVGGAHYGLRDWLIQRGTAVAMAIYTLFLAGFLLSHWPLRYEVWKGLFSQNWMRYFTLLFLLSLYLHAWVGVRNVLMDYVHRTGWRLALQATAILVLIFYCIWSAEVLWEL